MFALQHDLLLLIVFSVIFMNTGEVEEELSCIERNQTNCSGSSLKKEGIVVCV